MKRLLLIGLLFTSPLYAANSITLQGGPQHTPNSNYGDGSEFTGRYEHSLINNINVLIESSYHSPTSHYGYGNLSGYDILTGLTSELPGFYNITPYLMASVGWSWWKFDPSADMRDKDIMIKVGNCFADKFGIGANYPLGNNWYLNLQWSYFHAQIPKRSYYGSSGEFANVAGGDSIGQEETNVMIGIKKKF